MKKVGPSRKPRLTLPSHEASLGKFLTQSGTFRADDLLVNKDGIRIVQQSEEGAPPVIRATDNQLNLADIDSVKVIGKGNGGIVQLVRHKWTGQFLLSSLPNAHLLSYATNAFYDNGAISIVLEYMDGGSLDLLKKVRTIREPYLAAICKQREVKISDFGVSVILSKSSGQQDTFIGTYNYMSPERISCSNHGYVSDIWSLGLVMLESATGQFPYPPADNFYELLVAVVEQPSPCPPPDQFSQEFCSFISACLQKSPNDRQSASKLLKHPFLSMYDDLNIDLGAYFTNAGSPLATF
ncbi:hypothetical protein J5N97_013416 [Dioscorea zingiberensis]|uniref:mitogen-activated protein kinase kinase n=1 Tax=Dioscorea zingiberensis TaxID=325984 RepID=A0A9D5HJ07_9LILI|nr:hypothetical protein J5N97_013416 [Dioscorea zingiberensis]